jgi:hypothetical protein
MNAGENLLLRAVSNARVNVIVKLRLGAGKQNEVTWL